MGIQMFQSKERERRFKREQRANKLLAMSGVLANTEIARVDTEWRLKFPRTRTRTLTFTLNSHNHDHDHDHNHNHHCRCRRH